MRSILLISVLLFSVAAIAAVVPTASTSQQSPAPQTPVLKWVRTADGWEKPVHWRSQSVKMPNLHPAVVSGFVLLAGVTVLVAAGRTK